MSFSRVTFAALLLVNAAASLRAEPSPYIKEAERAGTIEQSLLKPWRQAWAAGDAAAYAGLFAPPAAVFPWKTERALRREADGIREFSQGEFRISKASGKAAIRSDAASYLSQFQKGAALELRLLDVTPSAGADSGEVRARVAFDLRGRASSGGLRTDRGELLLDLTQAGGSWRIRGMEPSSWESLQADKARFEDVTAKAGLDAVPAEARAEAIRRGGYALAVGALGSDGLPDIVVGGWGPMALLRNRGDGTFQDATKAAGLAGVTRVKSALAGDIDKDGKTDLVLLRFVDEADQQLVFYRNQGDGTFAKAPAVVKQSVTHSRPMIMTAADFDSDGRLDLYVGYPGVYDFTDGRLDPVEKAAHQAVFLNRGAWRFEEQATPETAGFSAELVRPHSALATDLDGDGKADLVVVDDRGYSSRLYLNHSGSFSASEEARLGAVNRSLGMMAVAGDASNGGKEDLYFSSIDLSAARRLLARGPVPDALKALQGNRLYHARPDGSFEDATERAGVGWAGEAPAGAVWVDYNNDGRLDLYVTNGLWSGDPERDYAETFVEDRLKDVGTPNDHSPNPVMRKLQETGMSFAGYQRNRLFRNNGDSTFTEVGFLTGTDRLEDGYVAAFLDYDHDGKLDLVLRNADPPSLKRSYAPLVLLRNSGEAPLSLEVYLKPKEGTSPFGARLTLEAAGLQQTRLVHAVEGAVQSEAVAFFGLGAAKAADSLEVRWPSGRVDHFNALKPGRILIREGEPGFTLLARR